MVRARLPGARGVACGRHIPRAALRPCTGRSFVGSKCPQSTERLQRRVPSSCDTVLGRGRLRRDHFRAGGTTWRGLRAETARIALAVIAAWRTAPAAFVGCTSAYGLHHGGTSHSGKHFERNCSCAFSAAFPVRTLQLAYLLRGGEIQRAHLALSACAVSSGSREIFFRTCNFLLAVRQCCQEGLWSR
jgi:hypothetical protein